MDQQSAKIQRIYEYISDLDSKRQKERRRRATIILLSVLSFVSVGVILFFVLFRQPTALSQKTTIYNLKDLNIEQVDSFFRQSQEEMLVKIPGSEQLISLSSEEDYWKLIDEYALREIGINEILEPSESPLPPSGNEALVVDTVTAVSFSAETLRGDFNITGQRSTGNLLVFTITNYNPGISYSVDFGNGIRRRSVSQRFGYRYPRNGRFTAILKGSYQGDEIISSSKFIQINPATNNEAPLLTEGTDQPVDNRVSDEGEIEVESSVPSSISNGSSTEIEENTASNGETPIETRQPLSPTGTSAQPSIVERGSTDTETETENLTESSPEAVGTLPVEVPEDEDNAESSVQAPLMVASQMPQFPGGNAAMLSFLNEKLSYPQAAKDFHIQGNVYVQFVVKADGSLSDTRVVRGLGYGCDQEALRIIKSMPKWQPGKQNGKNVSVIYTLPVKFKLVE